MEVHQSAHQVQILIPLALYKVKTVIFRQELKKTSGNFYALIILSSFTKLSSDLYCLSAKSTSLDILKDVPSHLEEVSNAIRYQIKGRGKRQRDTCLISKLRKVRLIIFVFLVE